MPFDMCGQKLTPYGRFVLLFAVWGFQVNFLCTRSSSYFASYLNPCSFLCSADASKGVWNSMQPYAREITCCQSVQN